MAEVTAATAFPIPSAVTNYVQDINANSVLLKTHVQLIYSARKVTVLSASPILNAKTLLSPPVLTISVGNVMKTMTAQTQKPAISQVESALNVPKIQIVRTNSNHYVYLKLVSSAIAQIRALLENIAWQVENVWNAMKMLTVTILHQSATRQALHAVPAIRKQNAES